MNQKILAIAAVLGLAGLANAQQQNFCYDKFSNLQRLVNDDLIYQARNNVRDSRVLSDQANVLRDLVARGGGSGPQFERNVNTLVDQAAESVLRARQALVNTNTLLGADLDRTYQEAKRIICGDDSGCRPGTSDSVHLDALNRLRDVAKNAMSNSTSAANSADGAQNTLTSVKSAVTSAQKQVDNSTGPNQETVRQADSVKRQSFELMRALRIIEGNPNGRDDRDNRDSRTNGSLDWLSRALNDFSSNNCVAR